MSKKQLQPFNIVRHLGQQNQTETLKGHKVVRRDAIFIREWMAMVPCAPYDDHFLYESPDHAAGTPSHLCTCGSPAVVINPEGEKGRLFVCMLHSTTGYHGTHYVNIADFPRVGGRTIPIKVQ